MDKALFMIFDIGLTLFFMILIIFIGIFAVHLGQLNTFEDQAQDVVSRAGGFNDNVQTILNKQAAKYYTAGGISTAPMFQVEPINYNATKTYTYTSSKIKANTNIFDELKTNGVVDDQGNESFEDKKMNTEFVSLASGSNTDTVKKYASVSYGHPIKYKVIANIPFIPVINHTPVMGDFKKSKGHSDFASNGSGEVQETNSEVRDGTQSSFNTP